MSADNWTQCPRCKEKNERLADEKEITARNSYGKVSAENFDELREQAKAFRKAITSDDAFCSSLREDYEIGIYSGKFEVSYSGQCQTCGFDFTYKYAEEV
jgi:hypothetical protein